MNCYAAVSNKWQLRDRDEFRFDILKKCCEWREEGQSSATSVSYSSESLSGSSAQARQIPPMSRQHSGQWTKVQPGVVHFRNFGPLRDSGSPQIKHFCLAQAKNFNQPQYCGDLSRRASQGSKSRSSRRARTKARTLPFMNLKNPILRRNVSLYKYNIRLFSRFL